MGRLGPGRRLLEVLWPLRNYGIGARVTKPTWTGPDCFWEITKLKHNKRAMRAVSYTHLTLPTILLV